VPERPCTVIKLDFYNPRKKGRINCTTLQHTATHRNTPQHAATHCNILQHTATYCNILPLPLHMLRYWAKADVPNCNTLQHTATHCNTLQHTATHCITLHHIATHATHCNTLQHTATHCNTLQHTATHCNTLQHNAPLLGIQGAQLRTLHPCHVNSSLTNQRLSIKALNRCVCYSSPGHAPWPREWDHLAILGSLPIQNSTPHNTQGLSKSP